MGVQPRRCDQRGIGDRAGNAEADFLTGLLGINVGGIPGADFPYGFAVACVLIGSIALLQWWMLRRLRWL